MRRLFALIIVLVPSLAMAKPWMGITPGESTRAEVVKKFGEPKKKVSQDDKEVLAYIGDKAIKGTTQAQFTVLATGKVEKIAVFPTAKLELDEVEETYGKACAAVDKAGQPVPACYVKVMGDDFKPYFWYKKLGLVVFFSEDKKTVHSIVFTAPAS
jgi:hypothetical protein